MIDIFCLIIAARFDESDFASHNICFKSIEENHIVTVFVNLLTFVNYLLLNHEKSESIVNIFCLFKRLLSYIIIILNEQQNMRCVFLREFMIDLMMYVEQLKKARLNVSSENFLVIMT